jgi:hypothetical protein
MSSRNLEYYGAFEMLKAYLNSKLAWDTTADVSALTADFFTNYFKDASKAMYDYYTKYRIHLKLIFDEYGYTINLRSDAFDTKYFSFGTLLTWKQCFENAYKAIEKYKTTDIELYTSLSNRILAEELTVDFTILKLYKSYYSAEEYKREVEQFKNNRCKLGINIGSMLDNFTGLVG